MGERQGQDRTMPEGNDAPLVLCEVRDGIGFARINRPETRNALAEPVRSALIAFLDEVRDRADVRVVVISAVGKTFVAGGDIKGFGEGLKLPVEERAEDMRRRAMGASLLIRTIQELPQPVVVSARGFAVGIGASIIFASDLAIVSNTAKVGLTHVTLGISPDGGATYFLPRVAGLKCAMQLALLGDMMPAEDLLAMGLVNYVVPDDELEARTEALAAKLAAGASKAQQEAKRLIIEAERRDLPDQLAAEGDALRRCAATDDWVEGLSAVLERRPAEFGNGRG
jgi:2-(1,2-epoxy-1,2-dihydrophenyl)acetyl-CoA isomerase